MYMIYDLKDNETCVGVYENIHEITEALGIKRNHVHSIISKKTHYKNRYRIEYVKDEPDEESDDSEV